MSPLSHEVTVRTQRCLACLMRGRRPGSWCPARWGAWQAGSAPGHRAGRPPGRCGAWARQKCQAAIIRPARPAIRVRSRYTAAAAASTAAPMAIRVICQPAMPPPVITRTPVPGAGVTPAGRYGPPGPGTTMPAEAAGMTAADASTAPASAARTAAVRPRRPLALRALRRRGLRPGRCANMIVSLAARYGRRFGPWQQARPTGHGRGRGRRTPSGAAAGRGRTTHRSAERDGQEAGQVRRSLRPGPAGSGRRGGGSRSCPGSGPGGSGRCGC